MHIPLLQVLLCLAAIWNGIVAATPLQFTLYHQVLHPASAIENADKGITPRGTILYETTTRTATYEPQSPSLDLSKDSGVYRIGLYNDKTKHLAPVAFTKLGSIKGPISEEITLYLSSDNTVYHISYVVKPSSTADTTVKVVPDRSIQKGPEPVLAAPVVVNPDGQPPVQEPEKTFIQKYWIYILPIIFILLTSGGAGGGGQQEGGGGGNE